MSSLSQSQFQVLVCLYLLDNFERWRYCVHKKNRTNSPRLIFLEFILRCSKGQFTVLKLSIEDTWMHVYARDQPRDPRETHSWVHRFARAGTLKLRRARTSKKSCGRKNSTSCIAVRRSHWPHRASKSYIGESYTFTSSHCARVIYVITLEIDTLPLAPFPAFSPLLFFARYLRRVTGYA